MKFALNGLTLAAAVCASFVLAACGSSAQKSSSAAGAKSITAGALATTQAVSAASTTTTMSTHRHKAAAAAKKAKSASGSSHPRSGAGHTRGSQSTTATTPSTTTTATAATHTTTTRHTTTTTHTTHAAPTVHGLPSPEITATSGKVRGWLHAPDHTPKVGKRWHYQVLAADLNGHPLGGTVATQFALGGTVVGKETPPTHPLKQGLLKDGVTFPPQAVNIPLTFQIVIHTHLGSVTLNWPVKARN